jgi:hypothetical protein
VHKQANLEVPDYNNKGPGSFKRKNSNGSLLSANSPRELKMSNANFSDLDTSVNEATNFNNYEA